ncbi:hypothetical protein AAHE18_18G081800 [Arachis hypogaea]
MVFHQKCQLSHSLLSLYKLLLTQSFVSHSYHSNIIPLITVSTTFQAPKMCRGVMAVASTTVGVMEVLKDQGYCRWNTTMKSVAQGAKNHVKSSQHKAANNSNNNNISHQSSSSSMIANNNKLRDEIDEIEHMKKAEESLRTVMYLSTWGPNS